MLPCNGSWRWARPMSRSKAAGCIYIGRWITWGQTIDFLLSAQRDAAAVRRFFRKVMGQPHTMNSRPITVDKNPVYSKAMTEIKVDSEMWSFSCRLCCKNYFLMKVDII